MCLSMRKGHLSITLHVVVNKDKQRESKEVVEAKISQICAFVRVTRSDQLPNEPVDRQRDANGAHSESDQASVSRSNGISAN